MSPSGQVNCRLIVARSADNKTCEITGTPTAVQASTTHTITATNVTGSDSATVDIEVKAATPVSAAVPLLTYNTTKIFQFNWSDVGDATHYKLMENLDGTAGFSQIGSDIAQGVQSFSHIVPLYARMNAQYILKSCNAAGCVDSITANVVGNLVESIGYLKASDIDIGDGFGFSTSISGDGATLAVGVLSEDSATSGVNTTPNEAASGAGAVYIFIRNGISWQQEAYIKASNTGAGDAFGLSVELSSDGNTLVVAAPEEDSGTSGINTTANEAATNAGAVYIFTRDGSNWQQEAYIKAGNAGSGDRFGTSVSLSSNGNTLAVGARSEDSNTTGINSTPNDFTTDSGAAYVFTRSGNTWVQRDYIKGSTTDFEDSFGSSISLNADGSVLAVGANSEDRNATGVDGVPPVLSSRMANSGAVYVFDRTIISWMQRAYIKAAQINVGDTFGSSVDLSADGTVLAISAGGEDSSTTGINTTPDELAESSGAVYVFSDNGSNWSQQAYMKASNAGAFDFFGMSISLSADGNTLAVGAVGEDGSTSGINSASDEAASGAGAAYLFSRSGSTWTEQAYIKASNTQAFDSFGQAVSLSADGNTLAVGAYAEDSATSGVNPIPDENAPGSGAVFLY